MSARASLQKIFSYPMDDIKVSYRISKIAKVIDSEFEEIESKIKPYLKDHPGAVSENTVNIIKEMKKKYHDTINK